jgi:hypothetical protein
MEFSTVGVLVIVVVFCLKENKEIAFAHTLNKQASLLLKIVINHPFYVVTIGENGK